MRWCVAATWPVAADAQQGSAVRTVGFLTSLATADAAAPVSKAFVRGLNESGFTEGRNVTIEYRYAEGHYDRLPALAADLVARKEAFSFGSST
jgi:putative tryptophan/tyrosine transport system substrate-binding protein